MQSSQLMFEGLNLMLFGMGFVFTFLTLLVFIIKTMSKAVAYWFPAPEITMPKPAPVVMGAVANHPAATDAQLIAVFTAAVQRYRQDKVVP